MPTDEDTAREGHDLIPIQPRPIETRYNHYPVGNGRYITPIYRRWRPGDSGPGGPCKLCESCSAHDDACLLTVPRFVPAESAPLFSTVGLRDLTPALADEPLRGRALGDRGGQR